MRSRACLRSVARRSGSVVFLRPDTHFPAFLRCGFHHKPGPNKPQEVRSRLPAEGPLSRPFLASFTAVFARSRPERLCFTSSPSCDLAAARPRPPSPLPTCIQHLCLCVSYLGSQPRRCERISRRFPAERPRTCSFIPSQHPLPHPFFGLFFISSPAHRGPISVAVSAISISSPPSPLPKPPNSFFCFPEDHRGAEREGRDWQNLLKNPAGIELPAFNPDR